MLTWFLETEAQEIEKIVNIGQILVLAKLIV